ncbi:hypothetical protein ALC53_14180, partial [Atta colombica]
DITELTSPLNLTLIPQKKIVSSPLSSGRRDATHVIMAIGTLGCHERRFRLVDDKTLPAACLYERKLDSTFALHFTALFEVSSSG